MAFRHDAEKVQVSDPRQRTTGGNRCLPSLLGETNSPNLIIKPHLRVPPLHTEEVMVESADPFYRVIENRRDRALWNTPNNEQLSINSIHLPSHVRCNQMGRYTRGWQMIS